MDRKNKLDEVNLANLNNEELNQIKKLEEQLEEKYYIIAFEK